MPAVEPSDAVALPPGLVPPGRPSSASTSSRSTGSGPRSSRFGPRFSQRVLTEAEQRYVRDRPETIAGRWAAKEAVSKVLGLGVRGIGWRDIEIERLPTGQPAVRLHGRAAARAEQLGMERIAVSITHESDYAVAIAFGVRTAGGRYVFPLDIEARLDDRERRILARIERLRATAEAGGAGGARHGRSRAGRHGAIRCLSAARSASGDATPRASEPRTDRAAPFPAGATKLDDEIVGALHPGAAGARPQGLVRQAAGHRRLARLRRRRAARLPRRRAERGRPRHARRPRVAPAAVRRQGRRGDDDGAARGRRRGGRPGAGARAHPRPRARRASSSARACARGSRPPSSSARCCRSRARPTPRRSCSTPRRSARSPRWTAGGRATAGRPS